MNRGVEFVFIDGQRFHVFQTSDPVVRALLARKLGFQFSRLALREKSAARLSLFETNYAERFKHLVARSARKDRFTRLNPHQSLSSQPVGSTNLQCSPFPAQTTNSASQELGSLAVFDICPWVNPV